MGKAPQLSGKPPDATQPESQGTLGGNLGSGLSDFFEPDGGDWSKLNDPLNLFGFTTSDEEKFLQELTKAEFGSETIQNFLPPSLRSKNTDAILQAGIQGIGDLIRNPGKLSPTVADAIRPRLAAESEQIARNFRGIKQNQEGAGARGNIPLSIRAALSSALDVEQNRAQRGARREALSDSEGLRRQDLSSTFDLLGTINKFITGRLGTSLPGANALQTNDVNQKGALLGAVGGLFGG